MTGLVNVVYLLVGKLRLLTDLFKHQLLGEFYFKPDIQDEWAQVMFPKLQKASWPLEQFLADAWDEKRSETLRRCEVEMSFFQSEIAAAMEKLTREESPLDAIFASARHVVSASHRLTSWQEWLKGSGADPAFSPKEAEGRVVLPPAAVAELKEELNDAETAFENAIAKRNDLDICRTSRILFLFCFAASVTAAPLWDSARRTRVISLHDKAVAVITEKEPRVHTQERLTTLSTLTPERCDEIVRGYRSAA